MARTQAVHAAANPSNGGSGIKPNKVAGSPPAATRLAAAGEIVEEGNEAPSFDLLDQDSQMFSSSALEGTPYVLYFYPKDDTPGCTREACDFRDSLARFASHGIRVIGVSPDAPGSHARFRNKFALTFPLLSDPDKHLAKAYGVWVKKTNYGREYMGVQRSTFFVDADGVIRKAWRSVSVPGHVDEILTVADRLM